MKTIYILNQDSKTSIPLIWVKYINQQKKNIKVQTLFIKKIITYKVFFKSDILHGHHIKAMYIALLLNKFLNKKSIFTVHGSFLYLSKSNKKLLKYIFKNSNKIVFVNKFLYDILPKEYKKIIDNKYEIILNGIELNLKYKKIDVYTKYNISKNDKIIFHPARFVREKNHLNIIRAFALLHKKLPNVKLILAGDGSLREEIEEEIQRLGLGSNIKLVGLIDREEVYNFLEKVDLFIMPSISEGLNIAFLEAMVLRSKIVVSDIEQFTYPFRHYNLNPSEYNVYFTNPENIEDMTQVFYETLLKNKKVDFDMGYFSLDYMIEKYIQQYEGLLNDN